jgi:hypothetical protein
LEQITNGVDNLLPSDFIILSSGSNDVGKAKLCEVFSERVTHTKVILLTIPVRHDLKGTNSNINKEIIKFNRLSKLSKLFSHLSVLEMEVNRYYYTKHGFHLNGSGQKMVSLKLAHLMLSFIKKSSNLSCNIIPMGYYEDQPQRTRYSSTLNHTIAQNTVQDIKGKRNRKKPVTKTNDFLWES